MWQGLSLTPDDLASGDVLDGLNCSSGRPPVAGATLASNSRPGFPVRQYSLQGHLLRMRAHGGSDAAINTAIISRTASVREGY